MSLADYLDSLQQARKEDRDRLDSSDEQLCMMCHAYGPDKRSLFVSCGYQLKEVVPEFIDLFLCDELKDRGYYLRICKSCRGRLLDHLLTWAGECRKLQGQPMDSDGTLEEHEGNIPVRINGAIIYMTQEQYESWRSDQ